MTEPNDIVAPVKLESSAQISAIRYAAIVMAATALAGLVVWLATRESDTRWQSAASVTSDRGFARPVFREENGRIYVSPPTTTLAENGTAQHQPQREAVRRSDASPVIAALQPPKRKPLRVRAVAPTPAPAVHGITIPNEPTPAAPAPVLAEPSAPVPSEPMRIQPSPNEPMSAQAMVDEPSMDEQLSDDDELDEPTADSDEPPWDEAGSGEPFLDEPPPDEPFDD